MVIVVRMQKELLLTLLVSIVLIGLLPKSKGKASKSCGKPIRSTNATYWYSPLREMFEDVTVPVPTKRVVVVDPSKDPQFGSNAIHKVLEAAVTAPITKAAIVARQPAPALDSIERHLADKLPCSKSCCGAQWPIPHMQDQHDGAATSTCGSKDYVPNDMSCGNGDDGSGCVCMSAETSHYIASRGSNS